jgi:hypothetical protein
MAARRCTSPLCFEGNNHLFSEGCYGFGKELPLETSWFVADYFVGVGDRHAAAIDRP